MESGTGRDEHDRMGERKVSEGDKDEARNEERKRIEDEGSCAGLADKRH